MHGGAGALQRLGRVEALSWVLLQDFHSVRLVKCHMKENHISTRRQNELGRKEPESFLSCGNVCADTHPETAETAAVFWPLTPPLFFFFFFFTHLSQCTPCARPPECFAANVLPPLCSIFTLLRPLPPKHISHGEARNRSEVCGICGQKERRVH